jgi:hypothetical protein
MRNLATLFFVFIFGMIQAQEFNCKVSVTHRSIQSTNVSLFENMEKTISEFINNRKWTNDEFKPKERIDCNVLINLTDMQNNENFSGSLTIQARRPVYNSSYNSLMFNYIDKNFAFTFVEFDPLIFNENTFDSNLTAVLAYYAYIILGIDYDSFSPMGGQPFFQVAELIVNNAQNASESGWKAMESRTNRYWLVEQILHDDFKPFRAFLYDYHRRGLDLMADNPVEGLNNIKKAIPTLQDPYKKQPTSILFQIFADTKYEEFINLFKPHDAATRSEMGTILKTIDPQHIQDYDRMISG